MTGEMGNIKDIHSPTFSELMPSYQSETSLAERRKQTRPPAIATTLRRPHGEAISDTVSPLTPGLLDQLGLADEEEISVFKADHEPEALRLQARAYDPTEAAQPDYKGSLDTRARGDLTQLHSHYQRREQSPTRQEDSHTQGSEKGKHVFGQPDQGCLGSAQESPLFSPLTMYFNGPGFPAAKRGEKTMIGKNGWLERTDTTAEGNRSPHRKPRLIDSLRKIAKDMAEVSRRANSGKQAPTHLLITLDPREQSLLICEFEYTLTTALNLYITAQLHHGRLLAAHLSRIAVQWTSQGRSRVASFRYDLETQLELVSLHVDTFTFSGRRQGQLAEIKGVLYAMSAASREMRVRTFCQPDCIIARWLMDAQSLFDILGVEKREALALLEVVRFFEVILERQGSRHG